MKAWILDEPAKLRLVESPPTEIAENQIKVKIEQVLLTTTDCEIYSGATKRKYPFIMGRNAVGVVSRVPNEENSFFRKMDRVVVQPCINCETCDECRSGHLDRCSHMQEFGDNCDGLLRNFVDLPYSQLHAIPDKLTNERALYVPYVAFCLNIVDALNLAKGRHIAIFSSTKLGLILAQLIAYYQAVPVFISTHEELLETARDMGIFYCINPDVTDVENEITMITGGRMCGEIVFFSNSDFNMKDVYSVLAFNANVCLAGYCSKDSKLSLAQLSKKHLNIFGVYNGVGNYSSAINLLVTDTVNVDPLLGDKIDFDRLDEEMKSVNVDDLVLKSPIIKIN